MECREYILRSRYSNRVNKSEKEAVEKILLCCGMKAEKKIAEITPEQRLKKLDTGLSNIYKMMLELDIISADLIDTNSRFYTGLSLVVTHSKGQFKIPIEHYSKENDEEIQNIFFNALNLPVTSKLKTA